MVNHPNRAKPYPSRVLANALRDRGMDASCQWEERGPKDTQIAWMAMYLVKPENAKPQLILVQTFKNGLGWQAFVQAAPHTIDTDATIADVVSRLGGQS
jgi:hypothetical protein